MKGLRIQASGWAAVARKRVGASEWAVTKIERMAPCFLLRRRQSDNVEAGGPQRVLNLQADKIVILDDEHAGPRRRG